MSTKMNEWVFKYIELHKDRVDVNVASKLFAVIILLWYNHNKPSQATMAERLKVIISHLVKLIFEVSYITAGHDKTQGDQVLIWIKGQRV